MFVILWMHFKYLNVSLPEKLTELPIFCCYLWKTYFLETWFFWTSDFSQLIFLPTYIFGQIIFDSSLVCLTHFLTNWFFDNFFLTTDFLTTIFFDSLSNYLTDQLVVWHSRPLVLFLSIHMTVIAQCPVSLIVVI